MFERHELLLRLMDIIPLALSLTVHEWAHAMSASLLGDDTAEREGRLTLNPLMHIDPLGTVILPLLGIPFGWARPVPVNPARFHRHVNMRMGMLLTAAAGPASNLVIALACAVGAGVALRMGWLGMGDPALMLLLTTIGMNAALALFNMLPIPPLDGSRVVDGLMPARWESTWNRYLQYGPALLLFLIMAPRLLGFSLLAWPLSLAQSAAYSIVGVVARF